jgi:hypothetical protein
MRPKKYAIGAILLSLILVMASGCRKSTTQGAAGKNSADQTTAPQSSADGTVRDNLPSNSSADSQTQNPQAGPNEAPQKLIIPAGTPITVRLEERLSSASAVPGERFEAVVDEPVVIGGQIAVPVGAVAEGHVTIARHSGRLHHPGELGLTLDKVTVDDQIINLETSRVVARGGSHKKRNWGWIGGGTGGGAVIGALAAGGRGALIGSGIGAVAGTTTAFITGKKDVVFGNERRLQFRLKDNVSMFG